MVTPTNIIDVKKLTDRELQEMSYMVNLRSSEHLFWISRFCTFLLWWLIIGFVICFVTYMNYQSSLERFNNYGIR